MSQPTTLHQLLDKSDWKLEEIRDFLEHDSSSINDFYLGKSPLYRVVEDEKCSAAIVKLLLQSGAFVQTEGVEVPLFCALQLSRDESVIKALLEAGADPDRNTLQNVSTLCYAFKNSSKGTIQLLLDAGVSLSNCGLHSSVLVCAADACKSGFRLDVFEPLASRADLEDNTFMNTYIDKEISLICCAMRLGADASDIKTMMLAGASIRKCKSHLSPLHCATVNDNRLTADLVRLLHSNGTYVTEIPSDRHPDVNYYLLRGDEDLETPLHRALIGSNYETEAIQLLLDIPGNDVPHTGHFTQLHLAMYNPRCKLSVVELLIDRGIPLDAMELLGRTALHVAIDNKNLDPSIVKMLLTKGAPVNQVMLTPCGSTALNAVVWKRLDNYYLIKMLLEAGARIGNDSSPFFELKVLLRYRKVTSDYLDTFKLFVKYSYLQDSGFDLERFILGHPGYEIFSAFASKCERELRIMNSARVCEDRTLREFAGWFPPIQTGLHHHPEKNNYNFDRLLKILSVNDFPVFFDVISTKVSRKAMELKLWELEMYTVKKNSNSLYNEKKIILNSACVFEIAQYLSDEDLLSLMVGIV